MLQLVPVNQGQLILLHYKTSVIRYIIKFTTCNIVKGNENPFAVRVNSL